MTGPLLSVVVAWQEGSPAACLEALNRQAGVPPAALEILLVGRPPDAKEEAASVRVEPPGAVRIPPPEGADGRSLPRLFGAGAARAQAPWIAFTETCCTPHRDWASSLLEVCDGSRAAAVGGAVEPAPDLSTLERALFFCDYAAFLRPVSSGPLPAGADLPGNNVAFHRDALPPASRLEREGFWKTFHCRRLEEAGMVLVQDPRPVVSVGRRVGLRSVARRRLRHGRCFGAMRAYELGALRRGVYTLAAPALPVLLTVRTLRPMRAAGRLDRAMVGLAPLVFSLHALWIAGEWIGNAFGSGDACLEL